MISAGKVSGTTIERSRTTDGWRGSGRTRSIAARPRRSASRSRFELGDEDLVLPRRAALLGERRREEADEADRRSPASTRRGLAGDEKRRRAPARTAAATPSASHSCSTTPLTSKKSTSRAGADQCSGAAAPVQARPTPRVSPAVDGEARADLEQRDVAPAVTPVVRDGVDQAGQERRPQHVELRRQRIGDGRRAPLRRRRPRTRAPPRLSMNPKVTASRQPGGGQHPAHQMVARDCADRAAAPPPSSAGTSVRACRSRSGGRPPRSDRPRAADRRGTSARRRPSRRPRA